LYLLPSKCIYDASVPAMSMYIYGNALVKTWESDMKCPVCTPSTGFGCALGRIDRTGKRKANQLVRRYGFPLEHLQVSSSLDIDHENLTCPCSFWIRYLYLPKFAAIYVLVYPILFRIVVISNIRHSFIRRWSPLFLSSFFFKTSRPTPCHRRPTH
jgi:hypothetical protein